MSEITIGNYTIGDGYPAFIIAEIGSNHVGNFDTAVHLINECSRVGVNAVKFQLFRAKKFVAEKILDAKGNFVHNDSYDLVEKYELPYKWLPKLKKIANDSGMEFLCTPFDEESAMELEKIHVPAYKIASCDITHLPFLKYIARLGKPILLSTGMVYLGEVERALSTIYGEGNEDIILLHCIANYPADFEDINLESMVTMGVAFGVPVGFSDHSLGSTAAIGAVAMGACVIEKHITIDKSAEGPDQPFALEIQEFAELVNNIRDIERAMGTGFKIPSEKELCVRKIAMRSICAAKNIQEGTKITKSMLKIVRPNGGIPPYKLDDVVGKIATKNIPKEAQIKWDWIKSPSFNHNKTLQKKK